MRTGPNHNRFFVALAALLFATTLCATSLEDLERMCHAGRDEYTAIRDAIVAEGESALPFLDATLADETKPWKVRFMAGVCTDYIRHGREIEAFLKHDWKRDPDCRHFPARYSLASGFPPEDLPVFYQRMKELGTWWFFIEWMFSLDEASVNRNNPYRLMDRGVILHAPMPFRYFAAKWAEEWSRLFFSGEAPYAGIFVDNFVELASDGTYPEGADLLLAQKGYIDSPGAESLVQVTTNLALLEELKASNPNLIYRPGFQSRIDELRRRQEEARAEAEARAARAEARAKADARAAQAGHILLVVASSSVLLAAAMLLSSPRLKLTLRY